MHGVTQRHVYIVKRLVYNMIMNRLNHKMKNFLPFRNKPPWITGWVAKEMQVNEMHRVGLTIIEKRWAVSKTLFDKNMQAGRS